MMKQSLLAMSIAASLIMNAGPALAAKVTGVDVVDGSITGADVQADSLTGANIDESTLAGSQISGVNAATLNGQASSAFATAAALSTLAARVTTLESQVNKLKGTSALTLQDLAGNYVGNGYQSALWTTPVYNPTTGAIVNYQPHLELHNEVISLAVNSDGTFAITRAAGCEGGVQWHGGAPATPYVPDCSEVTTGTIEVVNTNGSTLRAWVSGETNPVQIQTAAGGAAWVLTINDPSDGNVTFVVFTKQ